MADPHCKTPARLRVAAAAKRATSTVTARYISPMACHNRPNEEDWGIVVSKRRDALAGLHMRPAAAEWMPDQLRAAASAATATQVVSILHFVGGSAEHFASLTPAAAAALADEIDAFL